MSQSYHSLYSLMTVTKSQDTVSNIQQDQIFSAIGLYQGNKVAIKKADTNKPNLSQHDLIDLKRVSR